MTSPCLLLSTVSTSTDAIPSPSRKSATNGVTAVSSQTTIIFGRFAESIGANALSSCLSFARPARSMSRCPSLSPTTRRPSRTAL